METEFVLSLGEQQWTLPAGADTFTIGRASNADIRLQADDQISRIHARLNRDGGTWTLHDESRNGTGLNGRRITAPTPLTTGDRIHIGRSVLTFTKSTAPDSSTAGAPPSPPASAAGASPAPAGSPFEGESPSPGEYGEPAPSPPAEANPFAQAPSADGYTPPDEPAAQQTPGEDDYSPADDPRADHNPFTRPEQASDAPFAEQPVAERSPFREQVVGDGEAFAGGEQARQFGAGERDDEYGAAEVVPGFERAGDAGTWAAYPSADGAEPVRSPWEVSGQIDQSEPNWNQSASWPDPTPAAPDRRTGADTRIGPDQRTSADRRTGADRRGSGRDRRAAGGDRRPSTAQAGADSYGAEQPDRRSRDRAAGAQRLPGAERSTDDDAVGTVRLPRVLIAAGGVIVLGIVVNLIVTFFADGPGGALRWLVPPGIALVAAMVLALIDAASPTARRRSRLDVSVFVAIGVVLVGVGIGGFALTAGAQYVGGYLTGNESGEDRLVKPVAKVNNGITMTVENVTYTSHFTRVEVKVANSGKQAVTIPVDGTTFTAADGTALRADPGKSAWPSRIAARGTADGTITFKGHLPDNVTTAVLTFKSGNSSFVVGGVTLTN